MRRLNQCVIALACALMFLPTASAATVSPLGDRFVGILGSAAVGAGHRLLRSPVVYSPAVEELASRAFEIEDDLYEVHRITRTLRDSRRLLRAKRSGVTASFST